jgi:hypothetical protein
MNTEAIYFVSKVFVSHGKKIYNCGEKLQLTQQKLFGGITLRILAQSKGISRDTAF